MPLRILCLLLVFAAAAAPLRADDDLPNFNAPVDNSPLNTDKVNRTLGIPLFKDVSLWDEDDGIVAHRIGWPQESLTSSQSSFRLYPSPDRPLTLLGSRVYSCALYATKAHPTEVSIVFINRGDYDWQQNYIDDARRVRPGVTLDIPSPDAGNSPSEGISTSGPRTALDVLRPMSDDDRQRVTADVHLAFEKALKQDTQTLTDALTKLFGDPQHMGFGGGDDTRERVLRWDWQGHAFLLSSPKDAYVALRIVPVAFADNFGKGDVIDRDTLKTELVQRVKTSDSGDVVVTGIPMVDQGPKGYCVPATWERYMRYLGVPADMYVLANAAGTKSDAGMGTDVDAMVQNVDSLVTLYHRRIDESHGDLDLKAIAKDIDMGLPLMWSCYIHIPFEKAVNQRVRERGSVTDWSAWAAKLQDRDKTEIPAEITGTPIDGGHQRMIIGYNTKTNEIAISDSWSRAYAIRWITLAEANAISYGRTWIIEP